MSYIIPTQYIIVVSSQLYVVWIETPLALYKHHKHFFLNSTNHISNLPIEQNMGQFFICINIFMHCHVLGLPSHGHFQVDFYIK